MIGLKKQPGKIPRVLRRAARCAVLGAAVAALCAGYGAQAVEGYENGRLSMVSEPGADSKFVHYYLGGEEKTAADAVWSDEGRRGKALSLSGNGDFIEIEYDQLQVHTMTVSGWFLLRGPAEGMEADTQYRQRLLTLSHSDDTWLTVMPHAHDASKKDEEGRILDGVYMAFTMGKGDESVHIEKWNPAQEGSESFGLPVGEWHQVAVVMDGQALRLYIDGQLWFEEVLVLGVEEMSNNMLTIGSGRWGDPTLNALVDDLTVFDRALTAGQVAMLYYDVDPLAEGATLPPTTAAPAPTAPTTAAPATDPVAEKEIVSTLFGLPAWSVYLIIGVLVVFIGLSVLLSVYQPPAPPEKRKKGGKDREPPPSDDGGGAGGE